MKYRCTLLWIALAAFPAVAPAQWLNQPLKGTPRTSDGKPNLSAPAPRKDGKPDLSGIWQTNGSSVHQLSKYLPDGKNGLGELDPTAYFVNILDDYKPGEEPLQPAVKEAIRREHPNPLTEAPTSLCNPPGLPIADLSPSPYKIIQTPDVLAVLYEDETSFRQVHLDGRKLPENPQPTWLGYSVGHWDGDVLVVESAGFNTRGPLDAFGHRHSEALRVTERFHRLDFGHMELQITVDDPKTFVKPVTIKVTQQLLPDTELIEYFCHENETDLVHMKNAANGK